MDLSKLNDFAMSTPPREVEIVDKDDNEVGLTITVCSDTDPAYTRVEKKVQSRMNNIRLRGRTPKKVEEDEMERELFLARITDLKVRDPLKKALGGDVAFNKGNLIKLLYESGEFGAAARKQINEAKRMMAEGFGGE